MKKAIAMLLTFSLCLCSVLFAGCNGGKTRPIEEVNATTIEVAKDGSIRSIIVEDFSENYYDQAELSATIRAEIEKFNKENGEDSILLDSVSVDNKIVKVVMTYKNAVLYSLYNDEDLYFGTVKDALNNGKDLNVTLKSYSDANQTIGMTEIAGMDSQFIVIAGEKVHIRCAGKILYASEEARFIDEYEVDAYENVDETITIFK